jgi:hypothetical protein
VKAAKRPKKMMLKTSERHGIGTWRQMAYSISRYFTAMFAEKGQQTV